MAKPLKKGLHYFPKDTDFYDDYKIIDLMSVYGPVGYTIYDYILTQVYNEGYYLEIPVDKLALLAVRACLLYTSYHVSAFRFDALCCRDMGQKAWII